MQAYHDTEWGVPVTDDLELFERLALECFQAGLSWQTILNKRDAFRMAFRGFDPAIVEAFGPAEVERLMADATIVRNRAKIEAAIGNARAFRIVVGESGSFAGYLATFAPAPPHRLLRGSTSADIPVSTEISDRLSKDLKQHGFRFVGPTVVYAFMQSIGLVDDHLPGCFRYAG